MMPHFITEKKNKNKNKKNITKQKKQNLPVDQRIACNLLVNVKLKSHFIKGA